MRINKGKNDGGFQFKDRKVLLKLGMNQVDLSVVVPVYNEKENIVKLFNEIETEVEKLGKTWELIIVDDGSTDGTDEILKTLKSVKVITFRKNCGQSAAMEIGIQNSRGKVIITLDGDGQNDPADFAKLLKKLDEGYDAVCGWRFERHDPESKKIISRGAKWLRRVLVDDQMHDAGCTLRAYYRYCFSEVHLYGELHRMLPALLKLRGYKLAEVKVNHRERVWGTTKYNLWRAMNGLLDMVQVWIKQNFDKRPLYLFGAIGLFLMLGSGILLMTLAILRMFFNYHLSYKIWPLVGMFGFMSGLQLLIFGFIADLIIRNNESWLSAPIKSIKINE